MASCCWAGLHKHQAAEFPDWIQPYPLPRTPQADGPPLLVCKGALSETVQLCSSVLQGDDEVLPLDDRWAAWVGWVGALLGARY